MMKKLIFKKLFIFSTDEKLAKCLEFKDGINIISSSQLDGTDRGKSVVMRSLYHTFGADSQFDDKWNDNGKIYIVQFSIEDKQYYMYRSCRLFKLFDEDKNLLFTTIDRRELAKNLKNYFNFAVQLPNRNEDKLEITPPVYNYLLYFIDQDYYNGTDFSSFGALQQYAKYKENTLYYHFGAFDEEYFEIIKELENLHDNKVKVEHRKNLIEGMFAKINEELQGTTYSADLNVLNAEVEMAKDEYSKIVGKLDKAKRHLIELKNQRYELEKVLAELNLTKKKNEKDIEMLKEHICPLCNSSIIDSLGIRANKYNTNDDIIMIGNDIQRSMLDVNSKIELETEKYKAGLNLLSEYERKFDLNSAQVNDVLRHKGYIEIRNSLLGEIFEIKQKFEEIKSDTEKLNKAKRKYDKAKKSISEKYYKYLLSDKIEFGLSEIDEKRFKNITTNFTASGSNKPIGTVMWYMNLIKLKNEFNPAAIKFPIVFDSPNNAETDDIKKHVLLEYLLKNATIENQFIISTIGFDKKSFDQKIKTNIINLTNEKYKLLNSEEYEIYNSLLHELSKINNS